MTDVSKQAGHYFLKSFKITKYLDPDFTDSTKYVDLKFLIHSFNIVESMSLGSVRGSAAVYDPADLVSRFPFIGEELVEITYSDFFDVERTDYFVVYSVTDVQSARDTTSTMMSYKLHFVSPGKFFSETFRIARAYKPNSNAQQSLISDYVKAAFQDYYERPVQEYRRLPVKPILIEPTSGTQAVLIPRLTPEQTMYFFSRRAFSATSQSQSFRFFENRERYYFATNEFMKSAALGFIGYDSGSLDPAINTAIGGQAPTIPIFRQNYAADLRPERQLAAMYELVAIEYGTKVDTVDDLNLGGYRRAAYELDIMNGTVDKISYDHLETFNTPNERLPHNSAFATERMEKEKERFFIKDFASIGASTGALMVNNRNYSQLYNDKAAHFYHYERNKIGATIYGRNTLFAGSVIELELFKHITANEFSKDIERSGRYWVETVENLFHENIYTQKLVLSRQGIGTS